MIPTSDQTPDTDPLVPVIPTPTPAPIKIPKRLKERWFVNPELIRKQTNEQAAMHSTDKPRMKWNMQELEEDSPTLSRSQVVDLFQFILDNMSSSSSC